MYRPETIILGPVISEKSYKGIEEGKYSFKVHPKASRIDIGVAVEKLFGVTVTKVNVMHMKPKKKRLGKYEGKTSSWKKAIVTLKPGDKIEFFEAS